MRVLQNHKVLALFLIATLHTTSCKKESSFKCDLIPDSGPCKALMTKYYYDKGEKKCKEFHWGGCDGVVPFETLEECVSCECR